MREEMFVRSIKRTLQDKIRSAKEVNINYQQQGTIRRHMLKMMISSMDVPTSLLDEYFQLPLDEKI